MAVALALLVGAHADRRDMRLVAHLPEPGVADNVLVAPQHHVVRRPVVMQLPVVGIAWPGRRKNLALDRLHLRDVILAHAIDKDSGLQLHHGAFLARSSAAAGWT